MPQGRRRSISYRTFVTCDNPKGVVECGTIRKTKINNNSHKREQQQQQQQQSRSVVESEKSIKEGKKEKMCIQEITDNTGDKMNHVTKTKGDQGGDLITSKDLLRGALDLQHSLLMLGKLQDEALSRSRTKHRQRLDQGTLVQLQMGFQRPSRSSADGMKNAVRDSLLRQNMITNPVFEEHFEPRNNTGFSDMPSTSSSQSSSMVRSSNFFPSESSSSSTFSQRRKKKESNLIVRLMGLESPPTSPSWHKQGENLVNLPKPMYDVDSPRARKCEFMGNKQQSVEEILETLHFKGLLRSNSVNATLPPDDVVESEILSLRNECYDERPPIVIMKPLGYPSQDLEEPILPKFWLEGIKKPTSRRQSVEETVADVGASGNEEGGKFVKKGGIVRTKSSMNRDQSPKKPSEVVKESSTRIKGEQSNKLRDTFKFRNQERLSDAPKTVKQKAQQNVSSTVYDHRKEQISKSSGQLKKTRESPFVEENKKGKGKAKEIDNNVRSKAKSTSFESLLELDRSTSCRNQIRDLNGKALIEYRDDDIKPIRDVNLADNVSHHSSCHSDITSVSASDPSSPVSEITLATAHENRLPVHCLVDKSPCSTPQTNLQTLLLCNTSFLSNLEEVFDLHVFPDSAPYDVGGDRVLIDYANEVMKLKTSEFSQAFLPQAWIYTKKEPCLPSLDQILEEIKNGIEELKRYHGSASDNTFTSDYLFLKLERDVRFKSGTWEVGWRKLFSQDELELVIREIDKLILGNLIEELILEFMVLYEG